MDLNEARKRIPEIAGLNDEAALNVIHEVYYPTMDKAVLSERLGYKAPPPPVPERSTARAVGDLGLQFAGGAVSGVRMMTDLAGANNRASTGLRSAEDALRELQSATAKADQARIAEILQESRDKGFGDQVLAGIKAFGVAPGAMMAQALGTSVPTLATAAIPGVGPAAVAARLGAAGAIGAAQGAGNIKGVIYEDVKKTLTAEGKFTPEEIEARATEAQAYSGPNAGQIALGAGLGAVAGSTGMERAVSGLRNGVTQAAPGMVARMGMGAAAEAVPEMAQGGQEKFASNTALVNEGFDVNPMAGVVSGATMEGLAGGAMGAAAGIPRPSVVTPGDRIRATEAVPESGPMTRAANVATEQKAKAADAALQLGFNPLAGTPVVFPDGSVALGSEQETAKRTEVAGQKAEANQNANIEQFAANRPPMLAGDAARILGEAKTRGLDFTVAPHPQGGFMVVPRNWVTPQLAAQTMVDLENTIVRMAEADAAPVVRAPRADTSAQDLNLNTDPVAAYVDNLRTVNTPAAKLYVRDFDAGRITPEDVQQRMAADRGKTPDERLAEAAAEGLKMNPKGDPFKTLMAAQRATKTTPGSVIQVEGGYAIRTRQEPTLDAQATTEADAVPVPPEAVDATADTGAAPGLAGPEVVAEPEPQPALNPDQDWQAFPPDTQTLGLPRAEMPQVKAQHRGALTNYLNARGVAHESDEVAADTLKPTQAEFSLSKVQKARDFSDTDRSILVSADGYVVDGHHQWIARGSKGEKVKVIRLKAPIADLLPMVREFPSSTVDEATANVQDAQAPAAEGAIEAEAAPIETPAPAGSDGATADGVPAEAGAGDAQADGVASEIQAVMESRRKNNASGQGGEDADAIRAAVVARQGNAPAAAPKESAVARRKRLKAERETPAPAPEPAQEPAPAPVAPVPPPERPDALTLTPKQYDEAMLKFIAADTGAPMAEVREMYDTEGGRASREQDWVSAVVKAAESGTVLSRATLDKLLEIRPNTKLPADALPEGYQRAEARKSEAEEKQARIDNRKAAKESVAAGGEAKPKEAIADLGEKIGGARKDTAESTGAKRGSTKTKDERPAWARRFQITQVVDIEGTPDAGRWIVRDTKNLNWMKQPKQVGGTYDTEQAANDSVALAALSLKHRVVPSSGGKYEIWREIANGKRVKVVDQQFDSRDAAMLYMVQNAVSIIETNTTFGEADLPVPDNKVRQGAKRREGDVAGEDFMREFGFRGVEFGNWNNQAERQNLMNEAYDGLMDLAEVLGVPPRALGLGGDLALAFGARGQGLSGARAHYEPGKVAMNLTKMNGAGALAHEWFHALDHYFARQDGKSSSAWVTDKDGTRSLKVDDNFSRDAASGGFLREGSGVRPEVREAYTNLLKSMVRKAEQYVEDSARADKFVGATREDVRKQLNDLRSELAEQKNVAYYKRNNKPATADQLAEFDAIAQQIIEGVALEMDLRASKTASPRAMSGMRWTNDHLEKLSELHKAVRGRSGFTAEKNGVLDRLRQYMNLYQSRLKMLSDAQSSTEKTKQVPTDFAMDAKSLDQGRGTDYWTTPHELAARAFQGFVEDKVAEMGGRSPFLNYGPENAVIITPWGFKRPYPAGAERKVINENFQKLLDTIQTRESDDGAVTMFQRIDQDAQTDTPAFKRWFGNSKIVDADGNPLVVYRGSMSDAAEIGTAYGGYFTRSPDLADTYAGIGNQRAEGVGPNIMPVYLSMKNPKVIKSPSFWRRLRYGFNDTAARPAEADQAMYLTPAKIAEYKAQGFDGIINEPWNEIIAFDPTQIKSAIGNNGKFDPSNPDIRAQRIDEDRTSGDTPTNVQPDTRPEAEFNIGVLGRDIARFIGVPRAEVDALRPYVGRILPGDTELRQIAEAFGSEVQGFGLNVDLDAAQQKQFGFFGGVRTSGTTFLRDTGGDRPHLAVLGHELGHELRSKRPDLYDKLVDAIQPYVNIRRYETEFVNSTVARNVKTADKKQEEFIGEVLSDGFMDKDFWRALGDANPSLLRQIGGMVLDLVDKVLAKVGYTKRTERYLKDYKAVMKIAGEVMAEYGVSKASTGGTVFQRTDAPAQTDTPAFKKWFGDSKVVDADGKPRVVYHGTASDITEFKVGGTFKPGHGKQMPGIYLSPLPETASAYARTAANAANAATDIEGANVLPVYVAISNPAEFTDPDEFAKGNRVKLEAAGNDGAVRRNQQGEVVEIVAFRPDQIKSAIGNAGTFDPENPDIRFQRVEPGSPDATRSKIMDAVPQGVIDRLSDITTSQRGFNRWWHRTVGTQLHKAKTNKQFAPVYYAVQDFMKDVSRMATLAADQAPDLLPQVDSLGDIKKLLPVMGVSGNRKRKAELKQASEALFDGTLRYTRDETGKAVPATEDDAKGIIWTTAELKERGLSDSAIALYRQARLAINQSLDNLLAADVYRMITAAKPESLAASKPEYDAMMDRVRKAAASNNPRAALDEVRAGLIEQQDRAKASLKDLKARNDGQPNENAMAEITRQAKTINGIEEIIEQVDGKIERIADLKASGYAPLMRFGQYTLDAVDASGTRVFFGMYESQMASNAAARKFREDGLTVRQGIQSQREFELLKGVSPETAMLFAEMMGLEKNDAMQAWLQNAVAEQSALKRHIRRKGVEGFENDASRVVAAFITSNSRAASRALHGMRIQNLVENVRDGDVKDEAIALTEYVNNPKEEAQAIRSLLFVNYIGGSIASSLVNLTQTMVQTFPYLSQYGGPAKAAKRLGGAMKVVLGKIEDPDLAAAVRKAEESGVIKPQEVFQLQAEASRTLGSDLRVRAGLAAWGSFFQMAEVFNRRVAFVAAFQTAKEQGIADPYAFAENAVDETQGVFNKCVDRETEILTASGWKKFDAIKIGEAVFSIDKAGTVVDDEIVDLHVYEGQQKVLRLQNSNGLSIVATPNHDHLVQNYNSRDKKWQAIRKIRGDALKQSNHLLRAPLAQALDRQAVYTDDEVALFAWVAAEGHLFAHRGSKEKRGVALVQSQVCNANYVREIEELLNRLGGHYNRKVNPRGMVCWQLRKPLWLKVHEAIPEKRVTTEFAQKLTVDQMRIFLDAFTKADGHFLEEGGESITQKSIETLDVLQMMAVLSGRSSTVYHRMGSHPFGVLYVAKNSIRSHVKAMVATEEEADMVWCPQTLQGTWIARRNGRTFVTGNSNRPNWSRGPVGATLFTFKTFMIQYVEFLKRLPNRERALALGMLVLLSGIRGLPFAEDAEDLVDTVAQQLGYNFTTKEQMDRFLVATLGKGFADFVQNGASTIPGVPFDVSARLGMSDLLPGTALLKPSETRKEEQVLDVFGVAGGFVRDALKGEFRPIAIRNLAKGLEMYDRGIYTDTRGRKVMEVDGVDAVMKGIGLQPNNVAAESRAVRTQYEKRALFTSVKNDISEKLALGMFEQNQDKVKAAREKLDDWNEKNPEAKIVINSQAIRRRVVEMRKDRSERFLRSTPKELKASTREAVQ